MLERVIRAGRVEDDTWRFLGLGADADLGSALADGRWAVPLAVWKARREELRARREAIGVWLQPADDVAEVAPDLDAVALVAIQFPKFNEGRGYSAAALLRRRYRYRGELCAFGDIGRDNLFYLSRVGFDAFRLRPGTDLEAALGGLRDFSIRYQAANDEPRPLFRRRLPE